MSIAEFGALGEGIGSLLILVTLVYLAIQNRQQQKLMQSQAYQTRVEMESKLYHTIIENPRLRDLHKKGWGSEEDDDSFLLSFYYALILIYTDNTHYQHAISVLPDGNFKGSTSAITGVFKNSSQARDYWLQTKHQYRTDYQDWIDGLIQEIEQEEAAA